MWPLTTETECPRGGPVGAKRDEADLSAHSMIATRLGSTMQRTNNDRISGKRRRPRTAGCENSHRRGVRPGQYVTGQDCCEWLYGEVRADGGGAQVFAGGESAGSRLSVRQQAIVDHLERRVSPGSAAFFRNAAFLLADADAHPAVTHLVCHLLREVESAVRAVLEPASVPRGGTAGRHEAGIRGALGVLGVSEHDPVAQFWLDLASDGPPLGLAGRAHRPALASARPADDEFYEFVNNVEVLFERVLDRMETTSVEALGRLDVLLAVDQPTAAHADQLKNKTPNIGLTYDYFFNRASSHWLPLLRERGFFDTPPEVQIDEGGTGPAPWSASAYLARVAPECPDLAVEVATALPQTDNPWVNHDVVKTALAVRAIHAKRLVPRIIGALSSRSGVLIPRDVARLFSPLATGGEKDAAFDLGRALLKGLLRGEGRARTLDTYTFAEILKAEFSALVGLDGLQALTLISDLLARSIAEALNVTVEEAVGVDASHVWRKDVEGDSIVGEFDPKSALAQAVWSTADRLIAAGSITVQQVTGVLSRHGWLIFDRIILTLLARYGRDAPELVAARLSDRALVESTHVERELLDLIEAQAQALDEGTAHALLELIREGPDTSALRTAYQADVQAEGSAPAAVAGYVARWQLRRLEAAAPILTAEAQALHNRLLLEYGAEAASATTPRSGASRDGFYLIESPISASDLAAKSPQELVATLNAWQPSANDFLGPSHRTLATAVATAIEQDAMNRSAQADQFIGLDAIYAGAVINGLFSAANRGMPLEWTPLVNFCAWIGRQADEELRTPTGNSRRAWRDARTRSMSLLIIGLRGRPSAIQPVCVPLLWSSITTACNDPDPSVEDEDRAFEGGDTLSGLSLNRVRPLAIDAAILLGHWLRSYDETADLGNLLAVMESELAASADVARRSVRYVIGQSFPLLFMLDRAWATANVPRIFPATADEQPLWQAAWTGYVTYAAHSTEVSRALRDQYAYATTRLEPDEEEDHADALASRLGIHLVRQYVFGELELDGTDGLLKRYYANASPAARAQLTSSIGRDLENITDEDVLDRLAALWDARKSAPSASGSAAEFAAFGTWFASGRFDDQWALGNLARAITPQHRLEDEERVLPRLAGLAPSHDTACVTILEKWVRTEPTPWALSRTEQDMRHIVSAGLASSNAGTVESAKTIINLLLPQQCDLRDLLE